MKITLTWTELVNSYEDDQQTFEKFFCEELGIAPAGCFETTPEGIITTDEAYSILEREYGNRSFTVTPNADHIKWKGVLNSDFRISVNGGWKNPASAENGKKGGRPCKNVKITPEKGNIRKLKSYSTGITQKIPAVQSRKIEFDFSLFNTLEDLLKEVGDNVYGYDWNKVIVRIPKDFPLPENARETFAMAETWYAPKNNSDQRKTFMHHKTL